MVYQIFRSRSSSSGAAENRKDYAWAAGKALRFPRFAEPQLGPAVNGDVDRPFANAQGTKTNFARGLSEY